jgi:3-hydroxyisobutyrate dehydrogenase-like beta-hydroxyacid dehydrogenase
LNAPTRIVKMLRVQTLPRILWIGLGEMGVPMAAILRRAGYRVSGFDVDRARMALAEAAGVAPAGSLAEAVAEAEVVVAMVRTTAQVEALLGGPDGIAASAPPGRELDVVVMSTLDPAVLRRLARETAGRLSIVDAPVSGGTVGAEAGTLAIMASGPAATLARVRPILDLLGGSIFELGPESGYGQVAKLANQVMMSAAIAGTLEAMELARSYGLDERAAAEVALEGTGASWVLEHWDWMRSLWEAYEPGNGLDILIKDIRAVVEGAPARSAEMPVSAVALDRLLAARDAAYASRK